MMKNRILAASVLMAGFGLSLSSCSEDQLAEELNQGQDTVLENATLTLTNADGLEVNNLPAGFGMYYLNVKAEGKWTLKTSSDFLALDQTIGEGSARVKLLVGNNWGGARAGGVTIYSRSGSQTRAAEEGPTTTVTQGSQFDPGEVAGMFTSNLGAGYSYQPYENYCLGTHIQLFNLHNLAKAEDTLGIQLMEDAIYPEVVEQVTTADSEEDLSKKLSVAASVNLDFNAFSADVKGAYGSSSSSTEKRQFAVKRMRSSQYTREVHYANIIAKAAESEENEKNLLAPGFIQLRDRFLREIDAAGNDTVKINAACQMLVDELGPCFVSKAQMGCVLDYYISASEKLLSDTMTVSGALDIKFQTSVSVSGEGAYSDEQKSRVKNVDAKINVRGGDVNQVSILTTGGQLENEAVLAWQQSMSPKSAVMIDMRLEPIYLLFPDGNARTYLYRYLVSKATVVPDKEEEK